MKRFSLTVATIGLFLGALLFSLSSESNGRLHVVKQADASGLTYALVAFNCPSGGGTIYICGPGSLTYCAPIGTCKPIM
jgi:hypothetical protein